jgi:alkanesulfonate monooxygenase SsuD/methylene tetrahydromethanopterin reductase-like flavin-dependent oxidoreductase (luciferase family)
VQTTALVLFAGAAGADSALTAARHGRTVAAPSQPASAAPRGLKAWVQEYKAARPGNQALQERVRCARSLCVIRSAYQYCLVS